jgi:hypothetical protein
VLGPVVTVTRDAGVLVGEIVDLVVYLSEVDGVGIGELEYVVLGSQ